MFAENQHIVSVGVKPIIGVLDSYLGENLMIGFLIVVVNGTGLVVSPP